MTRLLTIILVFIAMDSCLSGVTKEEVETQLSSHVELNVNAQINNGKVERPFVCKDAEGYYILYIARLGGGEYYRIVVEHLGVPSTEFATVSEKAEVFWAGAKLLETVQQVKEMEKWIKAADEEIMAWFESDRKDEEIALMFKPYPHLATTKCYSFTKYKKISEQANEKVGDYVAKGCFVWRESHY